MNWIEPLARTEAAEALSWALLYSLPQGAAVAMALAAITLATRSPRIRYWAGLAALFALTIGLVATFVDFLPAHERETKIAFSSAPITWKRLAASHGDDSGLLWAGVVRWLGPVWLAGIFAFYLRFAAGWLWSFRLRRRGVVAAPAEWQERLAQLKDAVRVSRPVTLLESLLADTPMVLGHFRPLILVPVSAAAHLPPAYIEAILLHELLHIRRADYFINLCQRFIESLFFYHPAVWWMSRLIRAERENCCDDAVVALSGDPRSYAEALALLERDRLEQQPWLAGLTPVAARGGGNLMKRIHRLLYPKSPGSLWAPALGFLMLTAAASLGVAAWPGTGELAQASQNANSSEGWQKWLDEDVVYIVTDNERAAFASLKTQDERRHFAEQFWARRDPNTSTAENEFKEEHYRRIAYANEHFRTGTGAAGWRTDRGHMYIVYGPPDELEAHPKRMEKDAAQMWLYHRVAGVGANGVFTFVDQTGGGDYRLAPVTLK